MKIFRISLLDVANFTPRQLELSGPRWWWSRKRKEAWHLAVRAKDRAEAEREAAGRLPPSAPLMSRGGRVRPYQHSPSGSGSSFSSSPRRSSALAASDDPSPVIAAVLMSQSTDAPSCSGSTDSGSASSSGGGDGGGGGGGGE